MQTLPTSFFSKLHQKWNGWPRWNKWAFVIGMLFVISIFSQFKQASTPSSSRTPTEVRQDQLQAQFSGWDGSHIQLVKYIKQNLSDPDSFEHVKTTYIDNGDHLIVNMKFRAKNGFGAMELQTVKALVSARDGNIEKILEIPH